MLPLGLDEIRALERDVKARGKFDLRAFNQELVGHGTVPVKILRTFFGLDGSSSSPSPTAP